MFELAAERRVPILIHGGRGLPPIAAGLAKLVDRYPEAQLIIAHAGIADMAHLAEAMLGPQGRHLRHLDVEPDRPARLLPPGAAGAGGLRLRLPVRPVQPRSLYIALRTAMLAGYDEAQLRLMLGETAGRIADGEELPSRRAPPRARDVSRSRCSFARIHQYLSMATPLLWTRQADTIGVLGLAINACAER